MPPPSHHARRRGSSDDLASQPRIPVHARGGGEHDGGDLVASDLVVSKISPINRRALLCVPVKWGLLTHGTRLLVVVGALDRVHVVNFWFLNVFLYLFSQILVQSSKIHIWS